MIYEKTSSVAPRDAETPTCGTAAPFTSMQKDSHSHVYSAAAVGVRARVHRNSISRALTLRHWAIGVGPYRYAYAAPRWTLGRKFSSVA